MINSMNEKRKSWFNKRKVMEASNIKNLPAKKLSRKNWDYFFYLLKIFKIIIKISGLKKRGYKNALIIKRKYITHEFDDLPKEFDGFKILQLSDLHLDESQMITPKLEEALLGVDADICVMTGDYGTYHPHRKIDYEVVLNRLKAIKDKLPFKYPNLAILGNHDSCHMVAPMEKLGFKVLINESMIVSIDQSKLQFIGLDDVHYFYSDSAIESFKKAKDHFSIGLVHSPEVVDYAEENGVDLYLTGHSHGGQICLPGEIPLITHLKRGKKFKKGLWKFNNMKGYTSNGVGCSGLFLRFYCPAEIVIHELKKK